MGLLVVPGVGRTQSQGAWTQAFNHEHATANGTDARTPFATSPVPPQWPLLANTTTPTFNAVHMSLIPKGPHRGKVVVWDITPAVGRADPFHQNYWSFQSWSIVDPAVAPTGPRFRNFFLPINSLGPTVPPSVFGGDLFCSGHAWSQEGDLIVAGGTYFQYTTTGLNQFSGNLTFLFDPDRISEAFPLPGSTQPLYNDLGRWSRGPLLADNRYYPTVVRVHRLPRTISAQDPQGIEMALVLGGSAVVGGSSASNPTWNTYEALVVRASTVAAPAAPLAPDIVSNLRTFWGPGIQPTSSPEFDWLLEYPRAHLLSDGKVFVSGPVPRSARINHDAPTPAVPPWTQGWDLSSGQPGPASQLRHDGSSVLYPNLGGLNDVMVRIGGLAAGVTTTSVEACIGAGPFSGAWGNQPSLHRSRNRHNAVILPDGSVLVVGGVHQWSNGNNDASINKAWVLEPEVFRNGAWSLQPAAASPRDYHSTALLLPDGRVLVAGGNNHRDPAYPITWDYEVFSPHYLTGGAPRPTGVTITNVTPVGGTYSLSNGAGGYNLTCTLAGNPIGVAVQKVVLMAPGSVTHHSDMHQRYFEMAVTPVTATQVQFTVPGETLAPRGYYMLFAVTNGGIPSEAIWVKL